MKLNETQIEIDRNFDNFPKESSFKIKPSAKAFKILSDNLYSNKILAIVRELSCNALDSHIAAGKPTTPFDVQLPTSFEKIFRIRDYGVGLSHEDVVHLYTTYFESTKSSSNDYVGALGLGSKSPFCYTDAFTVTSYFDGMKRTYTAYINETGFPHIVKLTETETDEPNGLEVSLPTKSEDTYSFTECAKSVYQYFPFVPNFIECTPPAIKPVVYKYRDKNFGWKANTSSYNRHTNYVICGPVAYPLEVARLVDHNLIKLFQYMSMDIFVDIGEVDIAASREALSYNPETVKAISQRIKNALEVVKKSFTDQIDLCTKRWDAEYKFNQFTADVANFTSIFGTFKWRNVQLSGCMLIESTQFPEIVSISKHRSTNYGLETYPTSNYYTSRRLPTWNREETKSFWNSTTRTNEQKVVKSNFKVAVPALLQTDPRVFIVDSVFAEVSFRNRYSNGILVRIDPVSGERRKAMKARVHASGLKEKLEKFLGVPVKYTSEIDFGDDKEDKPKSVITKTTVYDVGSSYRYPDKKDVDFSTEKGLYLKYANGQPEIGKELLELIIRSARDLKIIDDKTVIYGLPKNNWNQVDGNANWQSLEEYIRQQVKLKLDQSVIDWIISRRLKDMVTAGLTMENIYWLRDLHGVVSQITSVKMKNYVMYYYKYNMTTDTKIHYGPDLVNLIDKLEIKDPKLDTVNVVVDTVKQNIKDVQDRFGLFFVLNYDYTKNKPKILSKLVDYINVIGD